MPLLGSLLLAGLATTIAAQQQCPPAITLDKKPQIFVMSDISNEPDDTMSFIRMLLHSDQYNITGMAAVTSYWLNSSTYPDQILNTTRAFGLVEDNLNLHSAGQFPTSEYLSSIVYSGHPLYGTEALGRPNLSSGAQRLIDVLDGMGDDEILHCQAWGGVNVLAEVLFHVQKNRVQYEFDRFVKKIRVYTISDQDNTGPWIRMNFPQIPYIVSLHGFNQYGQAAWTGISGERFYNYDQGGPNSSLVDQEYISTHFQIGPLGSHYPDIAYIMEGDSPSLMHTMMNGLNGGPYGRYLPRLSGSGKTNSFVQINQVGVDGVADILCSTCDTRQTMVYSDARDSVKGMINKNQTYTSSQATIWRWRQAYQDEMSARIQWSILGNYSAGSHPPAVSVNGSCDSSPLVVEVSPEQVITMDASHTYDPDANLTGKNDLQFNWFQYREISATQSNTASEVPQLNFTLSSGGRIAKTTLPSAIDACAAVEAEQNQGAGIQETCQQYHVILEVTGSGTPPIRRYKRVILKVQPPSSTSKNAARDEL
ncbi:hypothetical protein D0862_12796 [Hortaea werneckii]|uniref:DUF1593 domain-containing protein n=1 Tax=Hortaea werneckii TaxID=91943 RepID=A0A3M7EV26_HORWE|nr:hypothetical protein D0862_12796 [Hortaea werneckii]